VSLPGDSPNAYIHAGTRDGGLGISSTRWDAPLRRLHRLVKLSIAQVNTEGASGAFLTHEIEQCKRRLMDEGVQMWSPPDISR